MERPVQGGLANHPTGHFFFVPACGRHGGRTFNNVRNLCDAGRRGSGAGRALRKAEELRLAMESTLGEAEKWQGAFRRALVRVLKKRTDGEATHLRRELETATSVGEKLRSRGRRLAQDMFGRSSERQFLVPDSPPRRGGTGVHLAERCTLTCLLSKRSRP